MENNEWSIQSFENQYLEEQMKREEKPSEWWRGSDMGSCMRKRIWQRKGIKKTEEITIIQRRTMDVGSMFHWKYQKLFEKLGLLIEKEGEVIDESLHFKGHFDVLAGGIPEVKKELFEFTNKEGKLWLDSNGYDFAIKLKEKIDKEYPNGLPKLLYELKTQHSMSFQYIEKKPNEEHFYQLCSYLFFLREKYPDIKEGRILYISKDDSRLVEFPIKLTKEIEDKIINELVMLNDYWKNDELPPQISEIDGKSVNWKCRFCPYKTLCRGEGWEENLKKQIAREKYAAKKSIKS